MSTTDNPRVENSNAPPPTSDVPPPIPPRVSVTAALRNAHQFGGTLRVTGGGAGIGNQQAPGPNNNNTGEMPQQTQNLFYMRDRLFLALFFRVTLIYARAFPKTLRRILEFFLLMQSIVLLFLLCYIHIVYTRTPITCLNKYKDSWPRDGILRVEITTDAGDDYDVAKSYEKEEKLRQRAAASQMNHYNDDLLSMMLSADQILLDRVVSTAGGFISSVTSSQPAENPEDGQTVSPTASVSESDSESSIPSTSATASSTAEVDLPLSESVEGAPEVVSSEGAEVLVDLDVDDGRKNVETDQQNKTAELEDDLQAAAEGEDKGTDIDATSAFTHAASGAGSVNGGAMDGMESEDPNNPNSPYFNKTVEEIEIMKMQEKQREDEKVLKTTVSDLEMFANAVFMPDQAYIVEYALEYGFLRLSPETRQRLNIPVKIVTLDPNKESCFGDSFSVFLLENFLGYDDILMSSIKNLAEAEENKGYLRNVVTGEQFRFVPMWMARTSYIPAMLIMLVFTVSISMLLRYSHHQIFIFIVDLLNNIEGTGSIHIPAAPLFTVILALVGMEAIMSEFFNDTSTAFYVILIVWIADQYDSVCSHTNITKTFWVRFFYLYHFAFYAYHYRFNGQYSGLALLVSWSFIQHSMVYFYHHYELPAILRQAQQPEIPSQLFSDQNPGPSPGPHQSNSSSSSPSSESASTPTNEAAVASATQSNRSTDAPSTRDSPIQPTSPTASSSATSSSAGDNSSTFPISHITVALSTSPNVHPSSTPVVEISQGQVSIRGGEGAASSSHVRRRVSPSSTLYTISNSNVNSDSNESTTSSIEIASSSDALRPQRRSTTSTSTNERSSATVGAASADFSTHVSVSFSTNPIATASTARSGAEVSSLLGTSVTSSVASPSFTPLSRIN